MDVLMYIWQLPQNLLGIVVRAFYHVDHKLVYNRLSVINVCKKFPGCVSLGDTIIVNAYPHDKEGWDDVKHELGHQVQSRKWGWLYLIVIGLPSSIFNVYDRLFHDNDKKWFKWYYNLPWEKDADKKGGVKRCF